MKKEKFIVFDVEGFAGCCPYNVGYIIADRHGKIYKKHSFALPENIKVNISASAKTDEKTITFTARNIEEILLDFSKPKRKRKYKAVANNYFINFILKEIERYKIKKMYAFNVRFDKSSFKKLFAENFEMLENTVEFIDIAPIIFNAKLKTKKYCNFCIDNKYFTEKGYISTKAETIYRYITNNTAFIEEHTGLNDTLIEYEILLNAFKTHKKIDSKPILMYKVLDNFCKENNIIYRTV